jgi:hypothetical protein
MRKTILTFGAVVANGLMATTAPVAATDLGAYTVTATNSQLMTSYAGASTFAPYTDFAGYTGSLTTSVAAISGGALDYAGSTNPGTGIAGNPITDWVSAVGGNDETILFNGGQKYFGLLWGSVDPTNTITFYQGSTVVATYTGAELNVDGVGLQYYAAPGSFVDFVADNSTEYFNKVVLSAAGGDPFETSNFAAIAAPEPATWAMMILGLSAMGAALRRRRNVGPVTA